MPSRVPFRLPSGLASRLVRRGRRRLRAVDLLQSALVMVLTMLLLAIGLVVFPGLLPGGVRRAVGIEEVRSLPMSAGSGSYRFIEIQPGTSSVPVTYSPCQKLHYVINFNGIPPELADGAFIHDAVREISAASGFDFVYDGPTTTTRTKRGYAQGPILFDFAEHEDLHALDGAAAIGGSAHATMKGREYYTTGAVTFERTYFASLARRLGGEQQARAVALHEIGHVLGLDHVDDRDEVMDGSGRGALDLGPGDRTGLRILGASRC